MSVRHFKDRTMAACYEAARRVAADNFSEFYYGAGALGPRWPRRGAGHRDAYWNGRAGQDPRKRYPINSPAYAFCAAGADDAKDHGIVQSDFRYLGLSSTVRKTA